jgi:hypothetical protein
LGASYCIVFKSSVPELEYNDKVSGLLPFMYAGASLGNCRLDVVYELAMKLPDLLFRMHQNTIRENATPANDKRIFSSVE